MATRRARIALLNLRDDAVRRVYDLERLLGLTDQIMSLNGRVWNVAEYTKALEEIEARFVEDGR